MNHHLAMLIRFRGWCDSKQHAIATLQGGKALGSHRRFSALPTHKPHHGAIAEDEGFVTRLRGSGLLSENNTGVHERNPLSHQPIGPFAQRPSCHTQFRFGYSTAISTRMALPWIARQTFAGVNGMSACRTPNGLSASITAFTTAAGEPTVADSPTPLAPIG